MQRTLTRFTVQQVRRGVLRSLVTRASNATEFPSWLHLKAYAPYKQRMETTDIIANSISKSGGYLTHSTLLSDMATTLVMEDVDPQHLQNFVQAMDEIDGLVFEKASHEQLERCLQMVNEVNEDIKTKASHITNFQQSLHDIERDGLLAEDDPANKEFFEKCHEVAHELAQKVATLNGSTKLPVTVHAILQLTWKDAPGKTVHKIPAVHG